jgi:hypothetical protein
MTLPRGFGDRATAEADVVDTSSCAVQESGIDAGPVPVQEDQVEQLAEMTLPTPHVHGSPRQKPRRPAPMSPKPRSPEPHVVSKTLATSSRVRRNPAEAKTQEQRVAGVSATVPMETHIVTLVDAQLSPATEPDEVTQAEVCVVETPGSTELLEAAVGAGPAAAAQEDQAEQPVDTKLTPLLQGSPHHKSRRAAPASPRTRSPKTLATSPKTRRKPSAEATSQDQQSVAGASATVPLDTPASTSAVTLVEVSPTVATEPDAQTETEVLFAVGSE